MKTALAMIGSAGSALRDVLRWVANGLSGNRLARIERAAAEAQAVAEDNNRLLRALHDRLQNETLAAHLLARMAETEVVSHGVV